MWKQKKFFCKIYIKLFELCKFIETGEIYREKTQMDTFIISGSRHNMLNQCWDFYCGKKHHWNIHQYYTSHSYYGNWLYDKEKNEGEWDSLMSHPPSFSPISII